jgi:hypothetical protein
LFVHFVVELEHDPVVGRVLDQADARDGVVPIVGRAPDVHTQPTSLAGRPELLDRARRDDPAVIDQDDAVAQAFHEFELMAGEDDGDAASVRLAAEHTGERVDPYGIETGERFIKDQDVGTMDERGGELHALLIAER